MIYLGIDPGKGGGIAAIRFEPDGGQGELEYHDAYPMPETEKDVFAVIENLPRRGGIFALIERVHAMPKQGVTSSFTFGKGYGFLRCSLIACGIPFEEVTPQKWQKAMGCLSKGEKNITKARAQQLFPEIKVTHKIADALLIAEHCRRTKTPRHLVAK
jgi:crossover junction endodeoxyribonuclease RuvC